MAKGSLIFQLVGILHFIFPNLYPNLWILSHPYRFQQDASLHLNEYN